MFGWFRRKNASKEKAFLLGYKNKKGLDLADYMTEKQARCFQDALVVDSDIAYYLDKSIKSYKIWNAYDVVYTRELCDSIFDAIDSPEADVICSAILRWTSSSPPLKPTE